MICALTQRLPHHLEVNRWSSYAANVQGDADRLITPHPLYLALDALPARRQTVYRALFQDHLDDELLHAIRESLNHELVLGR